MANADLSAQQLRDLLHYDHDTGLFTWKVNRGGGVRAGDVAGYVRPSDGYVYIRVADRLYRANRLAVLYMTGNWPQGFVDHRYGDRSDNRWSELRDITPSQNAQNRTKVRDIKTTTGLLGVHQHGSRYRARIRLKNRGRLLSLGLFDTPEAAQEAYLKAKRELHSGWAPLPETE